MVDFRTDKEVLQIMGNCVDFVCELIDYIAEYPDDDYMTMECLCRKLVKYDLIDKKDGYYLVADGINADRKTEPQTDTHDICTETHECVKDTHDKVETMSCQECKWWFTDSLKHGGYCQSLLYNHECRYEPEVDCSWK